MSQGYINPDSFISSLVVILLLNSFSSGYDSRAESLVVTGVATSGRSACEKHGKNSIYARIGDVSCN